MEKVPADVAADRRSRFCRPAGEPDDRDQAKLEEKLWNPECPLTNKQIDQFLVVAR